MTITNKYFNKCKAVQIAIIFISIIKTFQSIAINTITVIPENICVLSIPKCGTHLLAKTIETLTSKKRVYTQSGDWDTLSYKAVSKLWPFYFIIAHLLPNEHNKKMILHYYFKGIFIIRDPRDQVISNSFWIEKHKDNAYSCFKEYSFDELVTHNISEVKNLYNTYLDWQNSPFIYTTKFENLVGSQGGGTKAAQLKEIRNIAHHLGLNVSHARLKEISDQVFENTALTFREGQIGSWKKYFTDKHKDDFKKVAGQLLIDLGYEKDLNW